MSRKLTLLVVLGLSAALEVGNYLDRNHHMLCHSHDDLGWLKTVAGYYEGEVHRIFTTVMDSLDPPKEAPEADRKAAVKRKFHYSEVGFLKLWIKSEPGKEADKIARIRKLIANGQWEWVNGGISQADEACPFYEDILNNYFYGQRYLQKNFGSVSRTAWQVDPFGHSTALFYLAAKFGMTHGVFWRMDERTRRKWAQQKALQMVYQLPEGLEIVLHVLYGYFAPQSLGCDTDCDKKPFSWRQFIKDCRENDRNFRSDVIFMLGGDFQWTQAQSRFRFLEGVMRRIPTVKYSLFSEYQRAFETKVPRASLPRYSGDFFVYDEHADDKGDSWSGYFTTKPHLKYKIVRAGRLLRTLTSWLYGPKAIEIPDEAQCAHQSLEVVDVAEEFGVLLHHDAITGTAKLQVDNDYLARAADVDRRLSAILQPNCPWTCDYMDIFLGFVEQCEYMKVMRKTNQILVSVFNSQPAARTGLVQVFIPQVHKDQKIILTPLQKSVRLEYEQYCNDSALCLVYLVDTVEANAVHSYCLRIALPDTDLPEDWEARVPSEVEGTFAEDKGSKQFGSWLSGFAKQPLNSVHDPTEVRLFDLTVRFGSDPSVEVAGPLFKNVVSLQSLDAADSGHYILKYNGKDTRKPYSTFKVSAPYHGRLIQGVGIMGDQAMFWIWKLRDADHYNVETYVLATKELNSGLDIVLRVQSQLPADTSRFLTDSNGLFEVDRTPQQKEPKFENRVFPCTGWARLVSPTGPGLAVFPDRSQGVFSDNGALSFYLQRTAKHEDHKGNEEVLTATEHTFTRHIIFNYAYSEQGEDGLVRFPNDINNALYPIFWPIDEAEGVHGLPKMILERAKRQEAAGPEQFPPEIRLSVQVSCCKRTVLRLQNLHRSRTVTINPKRVLGAWDADFLFKEVDFHYLVENPAGERDLKDQYELKPLEFLTIVKMPKPKVAAFDER